MKTVPVPIDAYPNEGSHFIIGRDGYPAVVLLGGKVYKLDTIEHRSKQDASDLPLYEEIQLLAQSRLERDEETCEVVRDIDRYLVSVLASRLSEAVFDLKTSELDKRILRGRILSAKFTAVTIWREGKPAKEVITK